MIPFALLLPLLYATAPFFWLRRSFGSSIALPIAFAWGALLMALAGALTVWLPGVPAAATLLGVSGALFGFLAMRRPLPERTRTERRESIANRIFGVLILLHVIAIAMVYLWANAVHPPVLSDTLFRWSGPARGSSN